jgi:hypothetical protein
MPLPQAAKIRVTLDNEDSHTTPDFISRIDLAPEAANTLP